MFTTLANTLKNTMTRRMSLMAATAAGIAGLAPTVAQAHERHHDRDEVSVDIRLGSDRPVRRWVPAICEERVSQVWCEPAYRTVCASIYEAPVYRTVLERMVFEP